MFVDSAANSSEQNEAKATSHEAVDDEVDARVDCEHEIAGDVEVVQWSFKMRAEGRCVIIDHVTGAHDEIRQLADDKDQDDHDQNARVLTVHDVAAAMPSNSAGRAHRTDQPLVAESERRERNEKSNDEEETHFVDENVHPTVEHRGLLHYDARTVDDRLRRRDRDEVR